MEMVVIMVVASLCVMALGAIVVCYYLFAPRYEHRSPFLGQPDARLDSRFEKLWNRSQDEIEARAKRERIEMETILSGGRPEGCSCSLTGGVSSHCPVHAARRELENLLKQTTRK